MVGGRGHYLDKATDGRFFISGSYALLDAAGEWFYNSSDRALYAWMPDGAAPAGRVGVKTRDYCVDVDASAQQVTVANLSFLGCTFALRNCSGCVVQDVQLHYPTTPRHIATRAVASGGAPPPTTLVAGNDSLVEKLHLQGSATGGVKLIGWRNTLREALVEDVCWLGSLDYPAVEIGFGEQQPTLLAASSGWRSVYGDDNVVTRVTVRRMGNAGIVTSQLSNNVSLALVSEVGLIGLDHAGIHADNSPATCMDWTLPQAQRANCVKIWHHNWVHDAREKCMRGDDFNLNLTAHHNVLWNCGMPHDDSNTAGAEPRT